MSSTLLWMPGGMEWLAILVIALLLFGKKLPEVSRAMGKSITEFKKGLNNINDDINKVGTNDDNIDIENYEENRKV